MVMRTEKWLVLCIALLLIQLVACERGKMEENAPAPVSARTGADTLGTDSTDIDSVPGAIPHIVTEKVSDIEQKAPTIFTLGNAKSQFVKWRVFPAQATLNSGTKTIIYFQAAGNYRVFAIDSLSNDSTFIDVQVNNQIHQNPPSEKPILAHDVLSVTPIAYGDTVENIVGFKFVTTQSYPCTQNDLSEEVIAGQNSYQIKFSNKLTGIECFTGTQSHGTGFTSIYQIPVNFNGAFEIQFNDKVYKGTMKRKGKSGYEFQWPYDNGVVFTKKQL